MSKVVDFVKGKNNGLELQRAARQQAQISYFTQSDIQGDIPFIDIKAWSERNFTTNDYFTNWVKSILKTDNALAFMKAMRFPLPSAKLVQDDILPQLNRVFTAEDAYRRYTVNNNPINPPDEMHFDKFVKDVFDAYLFRHNDIVFTDLEDINKPYREIISIDKVVAIDCEKDGSIEKVAFYAEMDVDEGEDIEGFLYADDEKYVFLDREYNILRETYHDLGECPADFVSPEKFAKNPVLRKSIFSYVREELEDYVFLSTLRKMISPNGMIPVTTMLQTENKTKQGQVNKDSSPYAPNYINAVKGQQPYIFNTVTPNTEGQLQAGTIIKVSPIRDSQGKLDMSVVTDYFKFHYLPVEAMKYLDDRIEAKKSSIVSSVVGHYKDNVDVAKNEKQLSTGLIEKQDNLKRLAENLSTIITKTDFKYLAMAYGRDRVSVDVFFGTDFFLESQQELFYLLEKSPNPLETRNILEKINKNKYRDNPSMAKRVSIMYKIMPFSNQKEFDAAVSNNLVDDITKLMYLRFNYWIDMFEAEYGDILSFWINSERSDKEKIVIITNLITNLIKSQTNGQEANSAS